MNINYILIQPEQFLNRKLYFLDEKNDKIDYKEVIEITLVTHMCYYHPNNVAISTCKSCNNFICNNDIRKLIKQRQDTYCIICYESQLKKRANPLIYLILLATIEIIFYFVLYHNDMMMGSSFMRSYINFINGSVILAYIFIYVLAFRRYRKAKLDTQQFKSSLNNSNGFHEFSLHKSMKANEFAKCPNCGSMVNNVSHSCQSCGYTFTS